MAARNSHGEEKRGATKKKLGGVAAMTPATKQHGE